MEKLSCETSQMNKKDNPYLDVKYIQSQTRYSSAEIIEVNLEEILKKIAKLIDKDKITVVDVGCYLGGHYEIIKKVFPNAVYTGIDNSPIAIRNAKKKYPDLNFEVGDILQ